MQLNLVEDVGGQNKRFSSQESNNDFCFILAPNEASLPSHSRSVYRCKTPHSNKQITTNTDKTCALSTIRQVFIRFYLFSSMSKCFKEESKLLKLDTSSQVLCFLATPVLYCKQIQPFKDIVLFKYACSETRKSFLSFLQMYLKRFNNSKAFK